MRPCLLLAFATMALVADLPQFVGYVNDFARRYTGGQTNGMISTITDKRPRVPTTYAPVQPEK